MTVSGVPFFRPSIGEEEIAEVVDTLRSGWLTTGPKTRRFEEEFAEYLGGGDLIAIAVNSATAALHLALEAIGVGPGDEVVVPSMTFTATAEVVRYMGATPIFVDCDERSLNARADHFEAAITERTKAFMPVHFAGLACAMDEICALARRHGIKVVDDAAHALPAVQAGVTIGAGEADATAFSFYANKTMTTGEGGMLVTRNPEIAERARIMRLHGISRDVFNRFTDVSASWRYDIVAPGFKYNMTDVAAAIGLKQLAKVEDFRERRAAIGARYDEALADLPIVLPADAPSGDLHSRHLYCIRTSDASPLDRDALISGLQARKIGTSVHYMPLHRMSYWRDTFDLEPQHFPNADAIGATCLSLPLFMAMTDDEVDYVVDALRDLLGA